MTTPPIAFDPLTLPESNATGYPKPFRAENMNRWFRQLGNHAGLNNFGVNLVRIIPGGQSSSRHAHLTQDEFVYVLDGEVVMETNAGRETLGPGMCAGFAAGSGNAHRFVNRSDRDALILVAGDRTPNDVVTYPDIDNHFSMDATGRHVHTRKDGTPHEE